MLNGKVILITGGSGSFGKIFASTLLERYHPKKIIIYSRDELKHYTMQNSEPFNHPNVIKEDIMRFFIGDVRDLPRLMLAMDGVDIVIHAAALKHVPFAEYNPFEVVKTNVIGGQNVIEAARNSKVKKVIALSTDKAAAPINLYGATKLTSDKLFIAANNFTGEKDIKFSVVRYGNVMGSSGSVIPFFIKKSKEGILPITDQRMTRFNITLRQGVDFVLKCLDIMWGGELFVPKIPSYRILDLAKAIDQNCELKFVGIRAGEKIHEEMITETDALNTIEFEDYFVILPTIRLWDVEKFRKESNNHEGRYCSYGFRYNSGENKKILSVDEIRDLIAKYVEV